jgi:hypothetical protein
MTRRLLCLTECARSGVLFGVSPAVSLFRTAGRMPAARSGAFAVANGFME